MTQVRKLICDICGKEKDLLMPVFGGHDQWQTLLVEDKHYHGGVEKHFCSFDCVYKYLTPKTNGGR
jgi:hypothetical protein